ncbi:type II secretion system F family protein [Demequina sp. SO4-13]|uniref:type II secretion system F family protein n=1 Tax=Demequina sp. SO4-13 TaxID=3401027 RepID=UPI003AF73895
MSREADVALVFADAIALLESGLPPARAWSLAGVPVDDRGVPLAHAPVWRGERPAAESVVAACVLARDTGMPLARVLARVDDAVARDRDSRDAAEAQLAGPRMSARILRWLPLVGVGLAAAVDPGALGLLVTSPLGWAMLGGAGLLTWLGSWWMARLVGAATASDSEGLPIPVVLALVDAALAAGLDVSSALARTADATDPRTAVPLRALAAAHAYGGVAPELDGPLVQALARPLALAQMAGAPASHGLRAAMVRLDRESRRAAAKSAGELGVRLALPLALCLLPAFALAGVLPLIVAVVAGAELGSLEVPALDGPSPAP